MTDKLSKTNLVLATSNVGKIKEFKLIFDKLPWQMMPQSEFAVSTMPETGLTYIENALLKARHAAKYTGLPSLSDDSGLIVDALNGEPGLYSARYAGENTTREAHIAKLLTALHDIPPPRTARFYCVLVYLERFDDPLPLITEGYWEGEILTAPQGTKGFGYEPVFYVDSHKSSAANIDLSEKMRISHRGQALHTLVQQLFARKRHAGKSAYNQPHSRKCIDG